MAKLLKLLVTMMVFSLFVAVMYAFFIGVFKGVMGIALGGGLLLLTGFVTVICWLELTSTT
jgi:hypothetical protein